MNTAPICLRVEKLAVDFGPRRVLRDLDLSLAAGELVGVLGPSGAGKSTLFGTILGEVTPTRGSIELFGQPAATLDVADRVRAGVGYMPQSPSVLWDLTVAENLETFVALAHRPAKDALELMEHVQLEARASTRAGALSGGERRRLEFARALSTRPKLLVCDEPFAGVDPHGASELGTLLVGLVREGTTVLFADHHVEEALGICSRAVLLLDGSIVVDADPLTFREHEAVRGRYLGTWRRSLPDT